MPPVRPGGPEGKPVLLEPRGLRAACRRLRPHPVTGAYAARVPTPPFVLDLRRTIGTDLLWLTGVSAVVLREDPPGHVLLTLRPSGDWTVVSGILEPGEQPGQAVLRELLEETRVVAEVESLVDVVSQEPFRYDNGDRVQFLDLTFRCRYLAGEAGVGDDENLEVRWFALDALPDLTARNRERIERALHPDPSGQPWFAR